MNLFKEIEGLSGEPMVSALLRLLILRSQEIRDEIVRLISAKSPIGLVTSSSHFSCYTEYTTFDQVAGQGRIDIVIELDDAVVGIENKLFALFQEGQPAKYLSSLEENARALSSIRNREIRWFLLVLLPRVRLSEIDDIIIQHPKAVIPLCWEDVIPSIEKLENKLDPTSQVIAAEFVDFLRSRLAFIPNFADWVPHLRRSFEPRGTPLQRKLIGHIWDFFPNGGARLSSGATWAGYYFSTQGREYDGWYGFVPAVELQGEGHRPTELIVIISCPLKVESAALKAVTLTNPDWLGTGKNQFIWVVDFDETWSTPERWGKELQVFNLPQKESN